MIKRKAFVQNLITLGAFSFLPKSVEIKQYQKFYLLQCFVAGFRFYKGMELLNEMHEGDLLELKREPQNEHDECAIALFWNNEKIGFIPASENEVLSRLLDANVLQLLAEITHLNKGVEPWENLAIAIYFLKEIPPTGLPDNAEYLSQLVTPNYRTYKRSDNTITKVNVNDEDEFVYENNINWYQFLEDNRKNDSMYTIIHSSNVKPNYEYGKETGEYLIVNKKNIPAIDDVQKIVNRAENMMSELNELFDEDGYIAMTTQEAENLVKYISKIGDVADKLGRHYIELKF